MGERSERPAVAALARQQQRRLRAGEVAQLTAAYQEGAVLRELATFYGVSRQTVAAVLGRAGVARRYRKLSAGDVQEICGQYQSGLSLAVIGRQYGVQPGTIRAQLLKAGVVMRDSHGREC